MPSFDIVSRVDMAEMKNAVNGMLREIAQRYDFKGSRSTVELDDAVVTLTADDMVKLQQLQDLLKIYATRRGVNAMALAFANPQAAAGQTVRQTVTVRQGIDRDLARQLVKDIKGAKLKVQAAVQGDELRVTGKKRDDLQAAITHLKGLTIDQPLQYINFRE